ncbi:Tim10/DDP family zinc finger-domain-containing protein [Epithele typhae]|uniref:Tim10/DDP family zinc finger-domain-containing protein n=1 Tax=Epithele typhae TaxID=378194 RepID=UPI002008B600|nr:Tim10/DDP family zinc finger-domain-containing protein [Epithele typhae]KAH9933671.1 Tim10/DDP family zinc finger-domain-containing protein [Epithele typhae]
MTSLFGSSPKPASFSPSPEETAARVEMLKTQIRNEMAMRNASELMGKLTEKCDTKCVTKPGSSLSGSEQKCISQCMERYLEAFDIVSKAYVAKIREEKSSF